ncbi:P-loop containing nucleoside triphosphate hydrolase [Ostreococcus tauri]|uniref:P-loop containing nucleoside triphosphate hydrolase n=1 Tax=Ostreococcus tauri TaxID=70448 RepID=Q00ZJ0_OSTTA|nr:P-loop containing nucleoside triphosphate hydrolase [Ostreococcus tauri]CAL56292.1 P-loop containing nucleoside triphosphate hydrolase [Ostreococcus tauri]|eukprot:XP_003081767.1 P-loop containing nucleoside triphosphate hydrolase [Ostreococcus tauri]
MGGRRCVLIARGASERDEGGEGAEAEAEGRPGGATTETKDGDATKGEDGAEGSKVKMRQRVVDWATNALPFVKTKKKWEKMFAEADAAPLDHGKQDALMRELLQYDRNDDLISRFETRKYASGPVSVLAYMTALVRTNRLENYAVSGDAGVGKPPPVADPAALDKLPDLLGDLSERAKGTGELVELETGKSAQAPLHINIVGSAGLGLQPPSAAKRLLNWFFGVFFFIAGLSFLSSFLLRRVAVRVIESGPSSSHMSGSHSLPGTPSGSDPMSAAGLGPNGQPSYDPKQFNKDNLPEKSLKKFKDVKGCDEAKEELQEIVEYLRNPDKFTRLGGKLPKGVLLTGPPGTGKTLLARAVAGEADVPFFYRSGSEFEEMFVGVGSKRVRQLFAAAKRKTPCIVFIDEIDSIGTSRKSVENQHRKTLNQLLTEMDGFEQNEGIIVLAATNIPEALDPALTRPGRFDRMVHVPNPDIGGRREILDHYLHDKPTTSDVDVDKIARGTAGFSGAELYNLVNMAAVQAAMADAPAITAADLDWARDRVLMGAERKSAVLSEENRRLTAYHEAGHALVALKTDATLPIHKATIMPRGSALGMVMQLPDKDETSVNRKQLMARLDVCMGGRLAEELIFGPDEVTTGASGDLQQATRLAFYMISDVGMNSNLGPVHLSSIRGGGAAGRGASGSTESAVDAEVIKLLKESQTRVQKLLKSNARDLHTIAKALMEKETLTGNEIRELIGMPPVKEPAPIKARARAKKPEPTVKEPEVKETEGEKPEEDEDDERTIIIVIQSDEDESPK